MKSSEGRSMLMTQEAVPMGMLGGGVFDINGICKGMIEGVVQKPGSSVVGIGLWMESRMVILFTTHMLRTFMRIVLRLLMLLYLLTLWGMWNWVF